MQITFTYPSAQPQKRNAGVCVMTTNFINEYLSGQIARLFLGSPEALATCNPRLAIQGPSTLRNKQVEWHSTKDPFYESTVELLAVRRRRLREHGDARLDSSPLQKVIQDHFTCLRTSKFCGQVGDMLSLWSWKRFLIWDSRGFCVSSQTKFVS